jgi:lanthanide-dependent methanol dehydrogenase
VHFDRNGFAYVMDRTTARCCAPQVRDVDWAEKVDLKTGRPIKVREHSPLEVGRNVRLARRRWAARTSSPARVDPKEPNKFYCPTNNWCMEDEPQERTHTQQGTVYVFANVYMYPEKPGVTGKIKKFDV